MNGDAERQGRGDGRGTDVAGTTVPERVVADRSGDDPRAGRERVAGGGARREGASGRGSAASREGAGDRRDTTGREDAVDGEGASLRPADDPERDLPSVRGGSRAPAADVIAARLAETGLDDVALHLFDELPSTSRWLEERLETLGAGPALCATDLQSAGSGRRGRTWVSVRGNVALSLYERLPLPPEALGGLSLASGIAVANTLRETSGLDVRIKWPNDLVVDGAKVVGLLTSVRALSVPSGTAATAVVSGIGINLRRDERVASLGIGGGSLEALGVELPDRDALIGDVAARVLAAHARFVREGWDGFADEWPALDWLAGREIDVHGVTGRERVRALGVDRDGSLRVGTAEGERTLHGGEVSIRTTPAT